MDVYYEKKNKGFFIWLLQAQCGKIVMNRGMR